MRAMKINTDRIVSLSAMAVGIGSLIVVLYQTQLMRQSQRASVLPYLTIGLHSDRDYVSILVSNDGVGPGLIQDVRVEQSGRVVAGGAYDFYTRLHPDSGRLSVERLLPGRLMPAGSTAQLLALSGDAPARTAFLGELLRTFDIAGVPANWYAAVHVDRPGAAVVTITYESVYGERWRVRSDRTTPERVP
jgi:hypothetical protein